MSGHSKWSQIKHKKAITDARRSKIFSKLAAMISIAVRKGGKDPESNPSLRLAIEKAKEFNMPKENIERAIQRGSGELAGTKLEEITYEAYGPGGIGILIKTITDNKNRTAGEIKKILNENDGKLAESGSVSFQFEEKSFLTIAKSDFSEDLCLSLIEKGMEGFEEREEEIIIFSQPKNFSSLKQFLEEKNIKILSSGLEPVAKQKQEVDQEIKKKLEKLFEELEEQNEVEEIYSTLKV
ncbi:YebC/PmpR family DNA-binding transcriptional regulator [bacterium]|nr:YebC/PmpR family DNA-binding transcriptional regulator [bacterium]